MDNIRSFKLTLPVIVLFIFSNCNLNKCDDYACFTPPSQFIFQLVDKTSGLDLIRNGVLKYSDITLVPEGKFERHTLDTIGNENELFFIDTVIGWETGSENKDYLLKVGAIDTIHFTYHTEEVNKDCCTWFELIGINCETKLISYNTANNIYTFHL